MTKRLLAIATFILAVMGTATVVNAAEIKLLSTGGMRPVLGDLASTGLGTLGLASAATILAAIIAKANNRGTLYPVLSVPILLPLMLTVINATRLAVEGAPLLDAVSEFQVLVSYTVVMVTVSYLVFDYIWKE
jgi:heme exporter protein B